MIIIIKIESRPLLIVNPFMLSLITIMMMKARCGYVEEKFYSDAHHGLCRKCDSNFAFLLELEQR
jgi:hypothetical protein